MVKLSEAIRESPKVGSACEKDKFKLSSSEIAGRVSINTEIESIALCW